MLSYQYVHHWNHLPDTIKDKNNIVAFKNELKKICSQPILAFRWYRLQTLKHEISLNTQFPDSFAQR